jgi:hypothetical protein
MGVIHFALWSVFDPAALNDLNSSDAKAAGIQLGYAVSAVNGDAGSNYSKYISQFTIYSPDSAYQVCTTACGVAPPQEFLVRTPEPPFFALLGVDLSGLGALIFLIRRRSARS